MGLATLLLATSFVVGSIAGPLSQFPENQCATTCTDNKKFQYEVDKSYIYQYEATTQTELTSNSREASSLFIKATVEVQVQSKCNFILKLRDVEIRNPDKNRLLSGNSEFKAALEANPLDFSFQDGIVETLCPRSQEPTWVLNIKRGILSMFQNTMNTWDTNHNTEEMDITGKCLTSYDVRNGGWLADTTIRKSKNMLKCTDRSDHYTWIRSIPHQPSVTVPQSSPLIKSSHECEQTIRRNILQHAECKESHRFQPFANENSGATTNIQQKMDFKNVLVTNSRPIDVAVTFRTNLQFDHKLKEAAEVNVKEARDALTQLCKSSEPEIKPDVPRAFFRLVKSLKKLNLEQLQNIYDDENICRNEERARKLLMDAIPMLGSDASVQFMIKRHNLKTLTQSEVDKWLTALSLLPNPTKEVLRSTLPLLDLEGHRSKALFAVSALTHTYCKNQIECSRVTEVEDVVKNIVNKIPQSCQTKDDESIEMVVRLLKALGNIGYIDQAIPILKTCYENVQNSIEVRLAAIDAHRRIPCAKHSRDMLTTFLNREEDSEVRIGAYLIVMMCPTQNKLDQIEESLLSEDTNQVGSFVWTHLTALKNSQNPNKMMVKEILSSKKLQKKFSTDVRKFSRYYEGSLFLSSIETGVHVDGSVVFSPKSYLPRSTNLALNLDIFGESIDLFEIGGRLEGLEELVESIFGTNGYFPDETVRHILESYRDKKSSDNKKLNEIARIFNVKNAKTEELRGSFYTRLFGNEMQFVNFKNLGELAEKTMTTFAYLDKLRKLMSGEEIDFTDNVMLVDSSITIPTSIGLPLELKVNGSAAIHVKMGGKLDTTQISSKSLTIKGHIKPSAAVQIEGTMMVDSFVAKSGLKITTLVHTSTETEGEFIVKDGQTIKAQIKLPKDKMEIFDFKSSVFVMDDEQEREIQSEQPTQYRKCTGDFVSKYFGLELCGEFAHPSTSGTSPQFLSGPISSSIYLQKTDKLLTTFDFEYIWSKEAVSTKSGPTKFMRVGKLSLDTHKSAVNRELTAEFVYNEAEETVALRFVSPIKKATFNGKLVNDRDHKKIDALVLIDDKECLAFQSELRIEADGNNYRWTPSVVIRLNSQPIVNFKGTALIQDRKKYSIDFTVEHLTEQPIKINGLASKTTRKGGNRFDVDFNMYSTFLQIFGKWFLNSDSTSIATKGTIDYKWSTNAKQSITLSGKGVMSQQTANTNKMSIEAEFQWTLYPMYNWVMNSDIQRSADQIDNKFTLYYGSELHKSSNMLSIQHSYRGHQYWPKHHIATTLRVQFPPADIDTTFELKSDLTQKNLDTSISLQLTPSKKLTFLTSLRRGDDNRKELFSGFSRLTYPENELEISGSVSQPESDTLVLSVTGKWPKDSTASATVTVKNHGPNVPKSWGKQMTIEIRLPDQQPFVLSSDVLLNDEEHSAHGVAQINGQTYKSFAGYYRSSPENLKVKAGVNSPTTTYSATTEIQSKDQEKSVHVDVNLGDYRRIKSDVQLKTEDNVRTLVADLITELEQVPQFLYRLQVTLEDLIKGSQGTVLLSIPPGIEYGFYWKSKKDGNFFNGPASLDGEYEMWSAPGKKMTANINLKTSLLWSSRDVSGILKINTPWTNEITVYSEHKDDGEQWTNKFDIRYEKDPIMSFSTDGTYKMEDYVQKITSNIKLSSWEPLVTIKIDHQSDISSLRTHVIVNSGQENEFRLALQAFNKGTRDRADISALLDINMPFELFKKISFGGNLTRTASKVNLESMFNWNDYEYTADYEADFTDGISIQSNVKLTTTIKDFSSVNCQFKYSNINNVIDSAMSVAWVTNKVSLDVNLNVLRRTGSVHFTSPIRKLEDVHIQGAVITVNDSPKFNLKLRLAQNEIVELILEQGSMLSGDSFDYKISAESTLGQTPIKFGIAINHLREQYRFKTLFSAFFNEKTGLLNIECSRPNHDNVINPTWMGQFQVKTPLPSLNNVNMKLVHAREVQEGRRSYNNTLELAFNDEVASLYQTFSFSYMNEAFELVINLPFESLKNIKVNKIANVQSQQMVGETQISWTPGPIITLNHVMDHPALINLSDYRIKHQLFYTPQDQSTKINLFEIEMSINKYPSLTDINLSTLVHYRQQKVFETNVFYKKDEGRDKGTGRLLLSLPTTPLKTISALFQHNYEKPKINLIANIETPFENFQNNTLTFDFDYEKFAGEMDVTVNGKSVTVILEGDQSANKTYYVIRLKTPLNGFKTMSLTADLDVSNIQNRQASLSGDGEMGKFQLQTYYRPGSTINVGAIFTSSIPNYENVKFDYSGNSNLQKITITQGSKLSIISTLAYKTDVNNGFITITFSSPWKSTALDVKWVNDNAFSKFYLAHDVDQLKTKFEFNHEMKSRDSQMIQASLETPFEILTSATFNANYRRTSSANEFNARVGLDSQKVLNVAGKFQYQKRNTYQGELAVESQIPGYETVTVKGSLTTEPNKMLEYSVVINEKSLMALKGSLSIDNTSFKSDVQLTTSLKDYSRMGFLINYQKEGLKSVNFISSIDVMQKTLSLKVNYQSPVQGLYNLKAELNLPTDNNSPITSTIKLVTTPSAKKEFAFQVSFKKDNRLEEYSLTHEYDDTHSGYREYNLKFTSPSEESRIYANYNVQGVHNITYDLKFTKGKTMMESRGRFYANPEWTQVQGSLSFNTNYLSMISANYNGMYESKQDTKEMSLQSNVNGANNELMATITKRDNQVDIDIHGEISSREKQTFALRGWIKGDILNRDVQLTLTRNDDVFSIRGQLTLNSGKLTITSPYLEKQSLQVAYEKQPGKLTVTVSNDYEQLFTVKLGKTQRYSQTELTLNLESSMPYVGPINSKLTYDISYRLQQIQFNFDADPYIFAVSLTGNRDDTDMKMNIALTGNYIIPFIEENNLQLLSHYNFVDPSFEFVVSTRTKPWIQLKGEKRNGRINAYFHAETLGTISVIANRPELSRGNKGMFNVSIDGFWQEKICLEADYDTSNTVIPNTNIKITKGEKIMEFKTISEFDDRTSSFKVVFKSPFKTLEDISVYASFNKSPIAFEAGGKYSNHHFTMRFKYDSDISKDTLSSLTFVSSVYGVEDLKLILKRADQKKLGGITFSNKDKEISLTGGYSKESGININFTNTFARTLTDAQLSFNWGVTSAIFRFELNRDKVMEITAKVESQTRKSTWMLSMRNDFISQKGPLELRVSYDIASSSNYNAMVNVQMGYVNVVDASLVYTPGQFELSLKSMLESVKFFKIQTVYKSQSSDKNANIELQLNDRRWTSTGIISKNSEGFIVQVENQFPSDTFLTKVNYQSSQQKKLLGGELNVNGKRVGSVEGTIEINSLQSISGALQVDTPWMKTEDLNFLIKRDRLNENGVIRVQWSPVKKIEIIGKLSHDSNSKSLKEVLITMTTPFAVADRVTFSTQLSLVSEISIKSALKYRDEIVTGFEFNYIIQLPRQVTIKLEVTTPIENYKQPSFSLNYLNNYTPETNLPPVIETALKIKLSKSIYGFDGKFNHYTEVNYEGHLIFTTPFKRLETMKIEVQGDSSDPQVFKGVVTATLPSGKHSLRGNFYMQPQNVTIEIHLISTIIPRTPIWFIHSSGRTHNNVELNIGDIKRYIKWTNVHKENSVTGNFLVAAESPSDRMGYQWTYGLASLSEMEFKMDVKYISGWADGRSLMTATYNMGKNYRNMDAKITWASEEVVTVNYNCNIRPAKAQLKLNRPFFANEIGLDLSLSQSEGILQLTFNTIKNYIKTNWQSSANKKSIQIQTEMPHLSIPYTRIEGQATIESSIDFSLTMSTGQKTSKMVGKISTQAGRPSIALKISCPSHSIEINGRTSYRAGIAIYQQPIDASLAVIVNGEKYATSINVTPDRGNYKGNLVLEAPFMDKVLLEAEFQQSPDLYGSVSLTIGQVTHTGQLRIRRSYQESNIEFQLETPHVDMKSVSVKSMNEKGRSSKSLTMKTSSASHSFSWEGMQDTKAKKMRVTADTPYLKGGRYTLTGQKSQHELSMGLKTPTITHSVKINVFRAPNGDQTVKLTVNCPYIFESEIQLTGTLTKFDRSNVIGSLELMTGSTKQKLAVNVQLKDKNLKYEITLQTPVYNIGSVETRGQFSMAVRDQLSIDVMFKRNEMQYAIKGYMTISRNEMNGQLKVDTPQYPSIDVSTKFSWEKKNGYEFLAVIQTPTTKHNLELSLLNDSYTYSVILRVNSPLLPGQILTLSSDVNMKSPKCMKGQLSLENPGNNFKISSEYKAEPGSDRKMSSLIIVTPFEIAPYIKLSGQWISNLTLTEGEIEFYTVEKLEPDLGVHIQLQNDKQGSVSGSLSIQTSATNFRNIHVNYEAQVDGKTSFIVTHNKMAYGYQYHNILVPGNRNINVELFWGSGKSTLSVDIVKHAQRYTFNYMMDLQPGKIPSVSVQYETDVNIQGRNIMTASVTIGNRMSYSTNLEYSYQNNKIEGELRFTTPIPGYKSFGASWVKSATPDGQNIIVKWMSETKITWDFKVSTTSLGSGKGRGQIVIKTPMYFLDFNHDINFEWNGMQIVQGSVKKGDTKVMMLTKKDDKIYQLEFLTYVGPIKFTYEFEPRANNGYKFVFSMSDDKYPITMSLIKQSVSQKVFNYVGKASWGKEELTISSDIDLQQPNYKFKIGITQSARTLHLVGFCAVTASGDVQSSINLKWDAARDLTKSIGYTFKRQVTNNEQETEIGFVYPGIQKMTILTRSKLDTPLDYLLEYTYGMQTLEKVSLEIKNKNKMFDVRVRNPETNFDVQFTTRNKNNDEQYGASAFFSYIGSRNKQQRLEVEFTAPKTQDQLTLKATTSDSKMTVTGRIITTSEGYGLILEQQVDDNQPSKMEMNFKRLEGLKGIVIFNDFGPRGSLSMSAGMPDSKTIRLTSNQLLKDQNVNYLDLNMNLQQSRELQTRFTWRPELIRKIQETFNTMIRATGNQVKSLVIATKTASVEIINKSHLMLQTINKNKQLLPFDEEWKAIVEDFEPLTDVFEKMYRDNAYFINSLTKQIDFSFDKIRVNLVNWYRYTTGMVNWNSYEYVLTSLDSCVTRCENLFKKWTELAGKQIQKMPVALINAIDEYHKWGRNLVNNVIVKGIKSIKHFIVNWMPPVNQWKDLAPQWTRHISAAVSEQIRNYITKFSNSKYYQQLEKSVHQLTTFWSEIYNHKLWSKARMYYSYVEDQIESRIRALESFPWFQDLEIFTEKSYALGKWAYKFFRVEDLAKHLVDMMIARAEDVIVSVIADTLLPQYQLPSMASYILYEPLKGILEINQTLPVPWTSFTQLPDVYGSPEYHQLTRFQRDLLQLPKTTAKKFYNAMKSELSWKTTSPMFRATATLSGNQHYVTFDGKAYEFAGACSYLLANDFVDNKFALIVNYQLESNNVVGERVAVKSFNLNLGSNTMEIRRDLSLIMNNRVVETPVRVESARITRTNDVLYIADDTKQVFVTYNRKYELLKLEIGGFYHGKTGGLFGTYDHEHNNDLIDPSRQKVDTLKKFATSWEISPNECKSQKNYAYHSDVNSYTVQKTCKEVFNDHSLIACSAKINKEPYVNMCVNDVSLGVGPCISAATYVMLCNAQGYDVEMPESCMECEVGGSTIPQGQQVKLSESSIPKSADVVFVLDNTWQCTTTFPNLRRTVASVARYVEQALTKGKVPLYDNRYALVGLAESGVSTSPQAFTINGKIFGGSQFVRRAMNNTSFTAGHHHHISEIIEYAYNLPFRVGVAKILIVLPCSESVDNQGEYDALVEKIEDSNTIVHVVSIHDAVLNEPNKVKASDVIGFDETFAYTLKSVQRAFLVGDKEIRSQLKISDNPLTSMALDTDGSVFFASKLGNVQPGISTLANEAFSRRVALDATPAKCQNCLCTVGQDGLPKTVCSNCS